MSERYTDAGGEPLERCHEHEHDAVLELRCPLCIEAEVRQLREALEWIAVAAMGTESESVARAALLATEKR